MSKLSKPIEGGSHAPLDRSYAEPSNVSALHCTSRKNPLDFRGLKQFKRVLDFDKLIKDRERILKTFQIHSSLAEYRPPRNVDPDLYREVCIFRNKLLAYDRIQCQKVLCIGEIFENCLSDGPQFAKYLDKLKFYCYSGHSRIAGFPFDEEYYSDQWDGYDSVFPPSHLIHWAETSDDLAYGFVPDSIKESDISKFKKEFMSILKKVNEELIDPWSVLDDTRVFSTSSNLNPIDNKSAVQMDLLSQWAEKPTEIFLGKETIINVSPANARDCIMPCADDLPKIKRLHKFLSQVLDQIPYSAMVTNPAMANARIEAMKRSNHIFYMLDIRKCGITMSKKLILAIVECLKDKFTAFEEDIDILEQLLYTRVSTDSGSIHLDRGYNLGWANEIPTLVQCILFSMFCKASEQTKHQGIFYNDDSLISEVVPKEFVYHQKRNYEDPQDLLDFKLSVYIEAKLHLIVAFFSRYLFLNPKKIFASLNKFVFCEIYYDAKKEFSTMKNSLGILAVLDIQGAYSISAAKRLMNSAFSSMIPLMEKSKFDDAFQLLVEFWGYEYSSQEVHWPYEAGGWFTKTSYGLSYALIQLVDVIVPNAHAAYIWSVWEDHKVTLNRRRPEEFLKLETYAKAKRRRYDNIDNLSICHILDSSTHKDALDEEKASRNVENILLTQVVLLKDNTLSRLESIARELNLIAILYPPDNG